MSRPACSDQFCTAVTMPQAFAGRQPAGDRAREFSAGAADACGVAVQQFDRAASLSGLHPADRRASEVSGLWPRAADRLPALVQRPAPPGPRDRFIGWSAQAPRQLLAYNLRFLVLPWVQVLHLAAKGDTSERGHHQRTGTPPANGDTSERGHSTFAPANGDTALSPTVLAPSFQVGPPEGGGGRFLVGSEWVNG